ncbi:1-(5-phosphoribosyl)-5-[(5-phosphoribosylamino)methylideneamino] imidazole-4-carboxamide isomerase [Roseovarius litorisediminis]|uniref:1-(5-phosphoribosyl)-5-[(5-phosphoribosylamino)methylideneamino] imidazole-4-carboxamide isomerase n=1 Tax=Roseovarius litorisediminis TaxID=1312363 RepID=A0A1Y5REP2_9RHOB|nr:1-(5-phosphoribosyl)-5-[(5-phosphoribosylamino)methylideneamino] imidazole-4-carboxamide isomerase [Roseovarius litorisediminis]SLN15699.1 1-(5-phosphoribosyl)-5-[(5-phosphoribosylamino)methylideneamino] imidazole-4-carboxamide isomerase [Roseovarius litorisediminis]
MIIYPTLEILNGKCVSLTRGRLDEPVIWHVDPVETARSFAAEGAQWMHLTDIDGLRGGDGNNELLEEIIRSVGIPVQLGGGFRTRESVTRWIDKGAGRIVIGTMAAQDPHMVKGLIEQYPDQIVLAVDIYQGQMMTDGWRQVSSFSPETFIQAFENAPLAGVIVTDIDADIEDRDGSLGVISGLASATRHPVIARGTVRSVDDVARLKYVANIAGTLIGRALLSKDVDLSEALAVAQPTPEPTAEFQ